MPIVIGTFQVDISGSIKVFVGRSWDRQTEEEAQEKAKELARQRVSDLLGSDAEVGECERIDG